MQGNAFEKQVSDIALFAGTRLSPAYNPAKPNPYRFRRKTYFDKSTHSFIWENAKYASNYYAAQVQGCIPGDFDTVRGANIRTMDIVEQSTGTQMPNEWQCVFFQDPRIEGLYTGAKLWYAGNVWLCTAPKSVASDSANAVIRRCNAIWNFIDYYGNVITEPFVWNKSNANATSNEYLDYNSIAHDYQRCCMQLNDKTRHIRHNQRVVLGNGVYQVSGIVDFISDFGEVMDENGEFKQRQKSESHIMYFDLYKAEPLAGVDDMENEVADALKFGWKIGIGVAQSVQVGQTVNLGAYSLRSDAESTDVPVESTDEYPISYSYKSNDESVLTVDGEGNVTAVSEGIAFVTVTLDQNTNISATFAISTTAAVTSGWITITPGLPASMRMTEKAIAEVRYVSNGEETTDGISVTASGPDEYCYAVEYSEGQLTVKSYYPSNTPLEITITAGNSSMTKTIRLDGAV